MKRICSILLFLAVLISAAVTMPVQAADAGLPFADVPEDAWYYQDVCTVYQQGLMNGVDETTFAPYTLLNRATVVTVLYRIEGEQGCENTESFTDVPQGKFYTVPVAWSKENGLIKGMTETTFEPDTLMTREQTATVFHRFYRDYYGLDASASASLDQFADADEVHNYAKEALSWAVAVGLFQGVKTDDGTVLLQPRHASNRAQLATLLARLLNLIDQGQPAQPTDPTEPVDPTNPTEPTEPSDPVDGLRSSSDILDFIKKREGFAAKPFWDVSQWTVGYGTRCGTARDGSDVPSEYWDGISEETALELLRQFVKETCEDYIDRYESKKDLDFSQHEFDALVSFTFNLGPGWMFDDYRINRWLENPSSDLEFVDSMGAWCRVSGAVSTSICNRRMLESLIFLYGDYAANGDHPYYCFNKFTGNGSLLTADYTDDVQYYTKGATYGQLPIPEWNAAGARAAMANETQSASPVFVGWFDEDGNEITADTVVSQNLVLTARWRSAD